MIVFVVDHAPGDLGRPGGAGRAAGPRDATDWRRGGRFGGTGPTRPPWHPTRQLGGRSNDDGEASQAGGRFRAGGVVLHADLGSGPGAPGAWATCSSPTSSTTSRPSITSSSPAAGPTRRPGVFWRLWDLTMINLAVLHGFNGLRQVLDEYVIRRNRRVLVHTLIWCVGDLPDDDRHLRDPDVREGPGLHQPEAGRAGRDGRPRGRRRSAASRLRRSAAAPVAVTGRRRPSAREPSASGRSLLLE